MSVTLLNWATSAHVKRLEMAFVLIDERRADMSDRITGNPHVVDDRSAAAGESERLGIRARCRRARSNVDDGISDYTPEQLATLSAGMSLNDLVDADPVRRRDGGGAASRRRAVPGDSRSA